MHAQMHRPLLSLSLSLSPVILFLTTHYRGTQVLGREDPDAAEIVLNSMLNDGMNVMFNTKVGSSFSMCKRSRRERE